MGEKSLFYSSIRSPNYIIPQVQTEIIRNNRTTFPREDSLWLLRGTRTAPVRSLRRAAEVIEKNQQFNSLLPEIKVMQRQIQNFIKTGGHYHEPVEMVLQMLRILHSQMIFSTLVIFQLSTKQNLPFFYSLHKHIL